MRQPQILVYGYGNPGRQDDALGFRVSEWCEKNTALGIIPPVSVDCNYQLNVEDALLLSEYDIVIFADASIENIEDFSFTKIIPEKSIAFSTHSMAPASVISLCGELYDKVPEAFMLSIKGYSWELGEEMTSGAETNLLKALEFLAKKLAGIAYSY